jgi:multidrug efflux system membrane fusion protein
VKWAQSEVRRFSEVQNTGAVSKTDIEQKQNALDVALATQKAAEATLLRAQLDLEYCQIRSPIDGRAGQHLVDVGNVVNIAGPNGGTNMLVIERIEPIYADFTVPEQNLSAVRQRMNDHTLKTQVWLPGEESNVREGDLTFLDNMVLPGAGTVKLRATLPKQWPM